VLVYAVVAAHFNAVDAPSESYTLIVMVLSVLPTRNILAITLQIIPVEVAKNGVVIYRLYAPDPNIIMFVVSPVWDSPEVVQEDANPPGHGLPLTIVAD
jgi:hypothetical protein